MHLHRVYLGLAWRSTAFDLSVPKELECASSGTNVLTNDAMYWLLVKCVDILRQVLPTGTFLGPPAGGLAVATSLPTVNLL